MNKKREIKLPIYINGLKFTSLQDALAYTGVKYNTYHTRRTRGASQQAAIETPVAKRTVTHQRIVHQHDWLPNCFLKGFKAEVFR